MLTAATDVLRTRGHCPAPSGSCGGEHLFASADDGKTVYLEIYDVRDPAAIVDIVDGTASIALRTPSHPGVDLRVYALPHCPPTQDPNKAGAPMAQAPVFTVSMRHR